MDDGLIEYNFKYQYPHPSRIQRVRTDVETAVQVLDLDDPFPRIHTVDRILYTPRCSITHFTGPIGEHGLVGDPGTNFAVRFEYDLKPPPINLKSIIDFPRRFAMQLQLAENRPNHLFTLIEQLLKEKDKGYPVNIRISIQAVRLAIKKHTSSKQLYLINNTMQSLAKYFSENPERCYRDRQEPDIQAA